MIPDIHPKKVFFKKVIFVFICLVSFFNNKYAPKKKTINEKNNRRDLVFKKAVKIVPIMTPRTTKIP